MSEIISECTEPVLIKYDSFESFIARDDKQAINNIEKHLLDLQRTIERQRLEKEREEEKKEHPRERERD